MTTTVVVKKIVRKRADVPLSGADEARAKRFNVLVSQNGGSVIAKRLRDAIAEVKKAPSRPVSGKVKVRAG